MNDDEGRAIPVPAVLRPWVSEVSAAAVGVDGGQHTWTEVPDAATALVFRATASERGDLVVMGPRTRASYFEVRQVPFCVKVRIRPGRARPLLGFPVSGFVDRAVPLSDLWGEPGDRLARDLADLGSDPAAILDRLQGVLLARMSAQARGGPSRGDLVHAATTALSADANPRSQRVRATARQLNISERQLRNLFTEAVGVPPKQFARIDRVRTVLARASQERLSYLATDVGYFDQSHMTAEFRDIMGVPPRAFLVGQLPTATSCGPRLS